MKKRIIITLTVVALCLAVTSVKVHGPVKEARASCQVLRTFVEHVDRAERDDAKAMLETEPAKSAYWSLRSQTLLRVVSG